MLTFAKARRIAEAWIAVVCDGEAELVREAVLAKPYGWVFFYQSAAFLRDETDLSAMLVGNAPVPVDRINGEVRVLGTALPIEDYLDRYEKSLPPACLGMAPERPNC